MQGNVRRDTRPERALRSALHRLGLRYRVDLKLGTGRSAPRPDVAFTRARVAVFVDGCFWHGCPEHGVQPRANATYWNAKVARNKGRDARNDAALEALGWRVVRVWEHEDPGVAAAMIERVVRAQSDARASSSAVARIP
jgi:DNA mismatch endonuclease (patch repair protein)